MGLTLGVIAAPCIGPFILGLLTWVASAGDPLLGFLVFFILSLGLGLPLLILALFSGHLNRLPRSGDWMLWVRKLLGWVLVGMAAYFIRPVLPKVFGVLVFASVPLVAAIHLGWMQNVTSSSRFFNWMKTITAIAGVTAAAILIGGWTMRGPDANWQSYSDPLLSEAQQSGKPVVIDFSASWCAPCRELDEITFRDSDVVAMSENRVVMIKIDLTRKGEALNERLVQRYDVRGVPTVVFLDRYGKERSDLRLLDFIPLDQFLIRLAELVKISS